MAPSIAVSMSAMAGLSSLNGGGLGAVHGGKPGCSNNLSSSPRLGQSVRTSVRGIRAVSEFKDEALCTLSRRDALSTFGLATAFPLLQHGNGMLVHGATLPEEPKAMLCDAECERELENIPTTTTGSGLQYKDIVVGRGPSPPVGFQVAANYVAMVPTGKIFDSSLEKGVPYIFRVGASQVIKGLDEGILSMKVGGKRRLYIPGELAFPKGLNAAAGRPRVPPSSPVVFDVNLLYVPGLEDDLGDLDNLGE